MPRSLKSALKNQQLVAKYQPKRYPSAKFTDIYRPEVAIELWSATYHEWQRVSMLIDTGADYTVLPRYIAVLLGLDISSVPGSETFGVGGKQRLFFVPDLKIKIGTTQRVIPVGFIDSNEVPPLLGRHEALETFTLIFDKRSHIYFGE